MKKLELYTIKQIADLASVTTRTIRYYDQIDLLKPSQTGENGYRYYDRESLLLLQQILFLRELDVPLQEIQSFLKQPNLDLQTALSQQRKALDEKQRRLQTLIETIDLTLTNLRGEKEMEDKDIFEGFDQSQYEDEVRERWGDTEKFKESQRNWKRYSQEEKETVMKKGREITIRMVARKGSSPDDKDVQKAIGEYFVYMNESFYRFDLPYFKNLADMWVTDARFASTFEKIRPGGAEFIRQAVHIYCDIQQG